MKLKVLSVCFLLLIGSCKEEDPGPQLGCSTGMRDGERKLLRCCTQKEHLAGNNEAAGGVSYFNNYTQHQWEPVSNCKKCEDKYW